LTFVVFTTVYYIVGSLYIESGNLFLTISTFIFATFTGFFVSRQSRRYSLIREQLSDFDGTMSSLCRDFGHLGKDYQNKAKNIIK
jgi:hypothetical protein